MKEKSLVPMSGISIFEKIRIFFRKIFVKEKFEEEYMSYENNNENYNIREEYKNQRMTIELQHKYENGKVLESEMSEEEKDKLIELYKKQIEDLENKINESKMTLNNYKTKILEMKRKVEVNN